MARRNRRSFERRLHMILRQRIAARMSLVAWIAVLAGGLLMLPGFSTGQESAAPTTESSDAVATGEGSAGDDIPATAPASVTSRVANDAAASEPVVSAGDPASFRPLTTSTAASNTEPTTAANSDDKLKEELHEVSKALASARQQGSLMESEMANRVERVLGQLFGRFRKSGTSDEHVVLEAFTWILKRRPTELEQEAWSQRLKADDAAIGKLITTLLHSSEFTDPPNGKETGALAKGLDYLSNRSQAVSTTGTPAASPGKKARVQTLLRVIYDLPNDKAEVLAKFLNENVKGEIEARTEKDALVVTAEVGIQRTVAGIVSLMTGEPVTVDLSGGLPMSRTTSLIPVYRDPSDPSAGTITYHVPATVLRPGAPGVYPARPTERHGRRTRTVYETDPSGAIRPRTITEEYVLPDEPTESRDPSATQPRTYFTPESPSEPPKIPPTSNGDPALGP
jgi:hypothetical protein